MSYKVIHDFSDLQDSKHVYNKGDKYPRKGAKATQERISELLGASNKIGKPLIVEVEEKKPAKAEKKVEKTEEIPSEEKTEE